MYKPNFTDPRIIRKATRAWRLASINLHATKPREWYTRHIDTWFGHSSNLGKWLRGQLLICVDPYYNPERGRAKKYTLNEANWIELGNRLGLIAKVPCVTQIQAARLASADAEYGSQIQLGSFEYELKNNRLWNPIQQLDNAIRKPLFANYGYVNEYDIRSAAPVIITQYARQSGFNRPIHAIEQYLEDPRQFRLDLANRIGVDAKTAKKLITSRFAGAAFGPRNSIKKELGDRWVAYERLKTDSVFAALSEDIVRVWQWIKVQDEITGRFTSRAKWQIYFQEEHRVMSSVHKFLSKNNITYFHEHDGWRCVESVDLYQLRLHVRNATGYSIDFTHEVF